MKLEGIYKTLTDLIASVIVRGEDIVSFVDKMAVDLNNSEIDSEDLNKLRLEKQITATSALLTQRHNSYTIQMLKFVTVLQRYVDQNYISVNNFLSDNDILVKVAFADISEEVGYPIDPGNIESVS